MKVDDLVKARQKMKGKVAELEAQIKEVEADIEVVENELLEMCKDQGVTSFSTEHGTVSRVVRERFWTSDWPAMHQYILEHGEMGLMEQRLHQTNMKAWLESHAEDFPPGMNIDRKFTISIRKPTKKAV